MKRGRRARLATLALALAGGALAMSRADASAPRQDDALALELLRSHPGLGRLLDEAPRWRLQLLVGLLEEGPAGRPILHQYGFRAGAEYFYPASAVKLFAAVAALQRLAELRRATGLTMDVDTALVYHPLFADQRLEERDPQNLAGGHITVRQQIREMLLVSDNDAFNRLYDFVGQDRLAESLQRAGLDSARIVHRLEVSRSPEDNRRAPRIDLVGREFRYSLPERSAPPLPDPVPPAGLLVGRGYLGAAGRVDEPMDFSPKNRVALSDLQRGLCMIVRPDADCGGGFELDEADRELLLEALAQYPRQSANPVYDVADYPDEYVKFLLPGLRRRIPPERLRIYNKIGQAYGFTTENAWVVDAASGHGFFLAATLYTNEDGILNDDRYEYEDIALPFLADLGEAAARRLLSD